MLFEKNSHFLRNMGILKDFDLFYLEKGSLLSALVCVQLTVSTCIKVCKNKVFCLFWTINKHICINDNSSKGNDEEADWKLHHIKELGK